MSAGGETPRADEPTDELQRALDLGFEAVEVTLAQRGLELERCLILIRVVKPAPNGRDAALGLRYDGDQDEDEVLENTLERAWRAVQRTKGPPG